MSMYFCHFRRSSNGAFILGIEASEVGGVEEPSVRTEVTIIVEVSAEEGPSVSQSDIIFRPRSRNCRERALE